MPALFKKPSPHELSKIRWQYELYRFIPTQSQRQIERFLSETGVAIAALGLPMDRYAHEQDPALWKRFYESMCKRRRFLLEYENAWPIQELFDMKVKQHRIRMGLSPSSNNRDAQVNEKRPAPSPNQLALHLDSNRTSHSKRYSPYPAPRSQGEPSVSHSTFPYPLEPSSHPGCRKLEATPSSSLTIVASSQASFTSSQSTAVPPSSSQSHEPSANNVFVGCCECDHLLSLQVAGPHDAIKTLLGSRNARIQECIRVLCRGGMTNDAHMRVFAKWPLACRKAFVDDLGADKRVKEMLGKLTYRSVAIEDTHSTSGSGPNAQVSKIRQPVEEEWLSDPKKPLEFLLKAMDLPTNRGPFQEMVAAVRTDGGLYLSTYRPSRELFEAAVQKISRKNVQLFKKYEDQWPARFILKRLARELGVKPQDDHLYSTPSLNSSQSHSFVSTTNFSNTTPTQSSTYSKPPLLKIAYTCPIHPGPDQGFVAPTVQHCLQSRGLTDLIPVFALMGTSTEEDFEEFCGLSAVEKDEAVIAAGIKLNTFQILALKLELWKGVLDASDS